MLLIFLIKFDDAYSGFPIWFFSKKAIPKSEQYLEDRWN